MYPLISIVIPVFNVDKYLSTCLQSVLAQTYPCFEVVLVDDGSTDNSGKLCDDYAMKDSRVHAFHKLNGGLSDARNYGVQQASADLISFIDSDDFVSADYLSYLYDLMIRFGADMSCAGNVEVTNAQIGLVKYKIQAQEKLCGTEDAIKELCYGSVGAWARLYRKKDLILHPYPYGRLHEDLATTCKLVGECKKIAFSNKPIYFRLQHRESITHQKISDRRFDLFLSAEDQLAYVSEAFPEAVRAAKSRCAMAAVELLSQASVFGDKNERFHFERIQEYEKKYVSCVIQDPNVKLWTKISCIFIIWGLLPSKYFWPIRMKLLSFRKMMTHYRVRRYDD